MTTQASASEQNAFVGIDFGTTKTMVASYDPGKKSAKPLTFGRGKFEKPTSMYATASGDLLFGDDADDEGITDLPNHIRRFKMKLGRPGLAHVGRKAGTAQQLTTEFLANLRNQLQNQVLYISADRVVLTVPAMFGPAQRHELTTAACHAGFSHVELLEEPVAAGIAYCDQESDLSRQLRFIVVDWGGGTFDVAHLERCSSGDIKVHEDFVVGLDDIGGEAFDDELWGIASHALDSAGHGSLDQQPRINWGLYRRDLSRAKESLSAQSSVRMTFVLGDGKPAIVTLNRADFNNIICPMIQRAASFVSQLIARAKNAGCPPEFILLAGGTSRIPLIGEELERITGLKCRQWSDGREAIALGAAIRAHQLWGTRTAPSHQKGEPDRRPDPHPVSPDPGYSERKFKCPSPQCGKEIILTPEEFARKTYACPYCSASGSIPDNGDQDMPAIKLGTYIGKCINTTLQPPQEADIILVLRRLQGSEVIGDLSVHGELTGGSEFSGVISGIRLSFVTRNVGGKVVITWSGRISGNSVSGEYNVVDDRFWARVMGARNQKGTWQCQFSDS